MKFPKLYYPNIVNFDVKNIYLDITKFNNEREDFITKPDIMLSVNNIENIGKISSNYYTDELELKMLNKETIKYLIMNNEIISGNMLIAYVDDVELFKDKFANIKSYTCFISENSHNILNYIYNNISEDNINELNPIFETSILDLYKDNYIDVDTTKILIKNLNIESDILIKILENCYCENEKQLHTFKYIVNNIHDIKDYYLISTLILIVDIKNKKFNDEIFMKFKIIYDKFNLGLDNINMVKLYAEIIDKIGDKLDRSSYSISNPTRHRIYYLKILDLLSSDSRIKDHSD